jgi:hypothetical protein
MHVQKISNSKCKAIIEKSYKQTHQLYASTTSHLEAHVYVFIDMQIRSVFSPFPFWVIRYYFPTLENNDLQRFSSQTIVKNSK